MKITLLILLCVVMACNKTQATEKSPQNNVIKGNGNMYYKPLGKDADGCTYYSSFSPGKVTLAVLYYRKSNGDFTNIKNEADCSTSKK